MSRKIIGVTVGTQLPKPNFKQNDPTKGDYIKNKPDFEGLKSRVDTIDDFVGGSSVSNQISSAISSLTSDDVDIYVQNDEPVDAPNGAVWIDTDDSGEDKVIHVYESLIRPTLGAIEDKVDNKEDAGSAAQALSDAKDYTDAQISEAIDNLDLSDTYAPKSHDHTKDDITDFAHTHEIEDVTGLQTALDNKQPKGDYLTTIPDEYITETELTAKGYLTSYTETDPTVPAWAKAATKPTYTAEEVGALPNTTVIPSIEGLASEEYVDDKITAIPTPDVSGQIEAHDTSTDAHSNMGWLTSEDEVADSPTPFDADTLNGHDASYFDTQIAVERNRINKLINYVTPQMYGAKGDGVTDDTDAINACLEENDYVYIPNGTYLIDAGTSIVMHSNQVLELADDAVIKATIPDTTRYYYAITIRDLNNVIVRGGTIVGDRDENSGSTTERGYGIYIYNSATVSVENCELSSFRGDCIVIESTVSNGADYENYVCRDVKIVGCEIHNATRHGITVMGVHGLTIKDTTIYDANGKAYSCAMDAEVHYEWQAMSDFYLENVTSHDCTLGILFNDSDSGLISNVTIRNCNAHVLDFRFPGEVTIDNTTADAILFRKVGKSTINQSVIKKKLIIYPSAKYIVCNNCSMGGFENPILQFPAEISASEISTVEATLNNCTINTFASNVKDNINGLSTVTVYPKTLTVSGCVFNINNPNPNSFAVVDWLKIANCVFTYNFEQDGYPSSLIACNGSEIYIVGNVFDTTKATATNSDKFVLDSRSGNVFFANNVGIMTTKWGSALSYADSATGRTWTLINNVFRHYPSKGIASSGVTYIDIGNVYNTTS